MATQTFQFDLVHSNLGFAVRHLMVSKVRGRFTAWSGTLEVDDQDLERTRVEVRIDAASIDTHNTQRDEHLRSADFFDVEQFPTLDFVSTAVRRRDDQHLEVDGQLTIRGVTRPVTLDVEYAGRVQDPWGGERLGFSARTKIDRKDFGLTWNQALETGGFVVGNEITIDLEIEAMRQPQAECPTEKAALAMDA